MLTLINNHEYSTEFQELWQIRTISKRVFEFANPAAYKAYGGNCCRQMAFICREFLRLMIPEYDWQAYESSFFCKPKDEWYEHAWCYGTCDGKAPILVDLAFDNEYNSNYIIEINNNNIPCEDVEDKTKRFKFEEDAFECNEFYTGLKGSELIKIISKINFIRIKEGI